jgi:HSP20 family protein
MLNNRTLNSTLDRMMTLNRALDHAFNAQWTESRVWVPAIDVIEKKDAFVLSADLPGVDVSNVDIKFEQNVLTIRGSKRSTVDMTKQGDVRVFAAERINGTFERSVRLPEYVDGAKIAADLANGVLTVTVPKAQAAQARKIEITTASGPVATAAAPTTTTVSSLNVSQH